MVVYITKEYFDKLELICNAPRNNVFDFDKLANIKAIINLLNALPVVSNLNTEDVEKVKQGFSDSTITHSLSMIIIKMLIDRERFTNDLTKLNLDECRKIPDHNGYYFTSDTTLKKNAESNGVVIISKDYLGNDFYNKQTAAHLILNGDDYSVLKERVPPCSAMIIYDQYLFYPLEYKLNKLIQFLDVYKLKSKIQFHLTIITKINLDDPYEINEIENVLKILKLNNIRCEIIINNHLLVTDRLVYTNYSMGNIGHPFSKNETPFNQKFLGTGINTSEIKENYLYYKTELKKIYLMIKKCKIKEIKNTLVLSNDFNFKNRIFSFIND